MIELPVESVPTNTGYTVSSETPAMTAAGHLRDPTVSALVVLEDDAVVGVITESDFVALVAETDEPVTVETIMSAPPVTIAPTESIRVAAATMCEAGVKHLPVVDGGRYCGLVSASTIAPYLSGRSLEITWDDDPVCLEASTAGVAIRE